MDTAEAFQIVLDFVRANAPQHNVQLNEAANILEDVAVNLYDEEKNFGR